MRTKFLQDLKTGQHYEKLALKYIHSVGYKKAYIKDGYHKEYDIYVPELKIGVEVKSDEQYKKTGNFYVEYYCNGKPSGITTTTAKYYFVYLDFLYIIETHALKEKCRKYINTNRDKKGGDNNASKGIILPIKELI